MTGSIENIQDEVAYKRGLHGRSDDHAPGVRQIIDPLYDEVSRRIDPGTHIKVRKQDGEMKNVAWAWIRGNRYAFTYNHDLDAIEMKNRSLRGHVIHRFTNATPIAEIHAVLDAL